MLAALPPEEYPLTSEVAAELGGYGSNAHYEFVLDRYVSGLAIRGGRGTAGGVIAAPVGSRPKPTGAQRTDQRSYGST